MVFIINQVQKLCNENVRADRQPLIKQRSRKNMSRSGIIFELLEEGKNTAMKLKSSMFTVPTHGPFRQLASDNVDEMYGNVTLSMDFREGGGGSRKLHDMCNFLDEYR